ncbi:hypothetical protein K7432_010726 [Basidiobolus ranarum]|uniref:Uncharacterized protein n=1 Tax=Basidiobolus ranarum TaxID=34480 RepID=A0ABR2WNC0_9FUNG
MHLSNLSVLLVIIGAQAMAQTSTTADCLRGCSSSQLDCQTKCLGITLSNGNSGLTKDCVNKCNFSDSLQQQDCISGCVDSFYSTSEATPTTTTTTPTSSSINTISSSTITSVPSTSASINTSTPSQTPSSSSGRLGLSYKLIAILIGITIF